MSTAEKTKSSPLTLAQLFSTCVECFGLIHGGKEWDRAQHLELTKLGLQQGRLLAWGDVVGICEPEGEQRDARIDEADTRETIEAALKAIIDRPHHTDRVTQFDHFGLKPPKRTPVMYEPALDFNRLEAFREKLYMMRQRDPTRGPMRGKSMISSHWQIVDTAKFAGFVNLIRDSVDLLVELSGVRARVDMALKHDIRAFGWHPVFERARAARDMSKLKMVRDVCEKEYPEYAAAAVSALAQLDQEWNDNYQAVMERRPMSSEIPFAATKQLNAAKKAENNERRGSLFDLFKPKHKRKGSKQLEVKSPTADTHETETPRSKSLGHDDNDENGTTLTHARSKSISEIPYSAAQAPKDPVIEETTDEVDPLSKVDTSRSFAKMNLGPVTSMISRHDQAYAPRHASVA